MNSNNIELLSISYLNTCIAYEKILESNISNKDKEPSWDGNILLFKDEKHNAIKDGVIRIPVQIKGKCKHELLNREEISFPVRYGDLRNYLNERGVVYFVIAVSESSRDEYSIYYNIMTPIKLIDMLEGKESKDGEQTLSVKMYKLDDTKFGELTKVLKQYDLEWRKQQQNLCVDENSKIKEVSSEIVLNSNKDILTKFNQGDIYFYSKLEDGRAGKIFWKKNAKLFEITKIEKEIFLDEKLYYKNFEIYEDNNESVIVKLSQNLTIEFDSVNIKENNKSSNVKFKLEFNSDTKILENDLDFLENISLKECNLKISDKIIKVNIKDEKIFYMIYEMKKIFYILNSLNITLMSSNLSKNDRATLSFLIDIFDGKRDDVFISNNAIYHFELENRDFLTLIVKDEENSKISFYNLFKDIKFWAFATDNKEHYYKVPMFSQLTVDVIKNIDDESFSYMIKKINDSEFNEYTFNILNNILLEIILVYDMTKRIVALDAAESISEILLDKFKNNKILDINYYQIKKRKYGLNISDKEKINEMKDNENNQMILCCINILIGNYYDANINFKAMDSEEKDVFKKFPIWNIIEDEFGE